MSSPENDVQLDMSFSFLFIQLQLSQKILPNRLRQLSLECALHKGALTIAKDVLLD